MQVVKIRTLIQGRDVHSDTPQTRGKGIEEDYDGKCLSSLASARFHIMG